MTDRPQLAATIIRVIRDDGFAVNCTTLPPSLGGQVAYRSAGAEVRPPDAETWQGRGPDRYRAAVALADALGWELD